MANAPNKKEPITSYGILLFCIENNNILYLLAQRRDTIEYTDFLRGRYSQANLNTYFGLMTHDERDRISKYTFAELWDDLWVNHDSRFYRDACPKASLKFEAQKELVSELLKHTITTKSEPGWGFPKGKKNHFETEVQCAMREFKEETRMQIDYLNLLNMAPSTEIFKGSNGKTYSTVYYIAQANNRIPICKFETFGIRKETISEEISNLAWCTMKEAESLLPPWRYKLLVETEQKIRDQLYVNY